MTVRTHSLSPDWIGQVFAAKAVSKGGVIRRSVAWVENEIGRRRFMQEVEARGCHLLECGGQFIVVCNQGPIRKLV